jgi:hypothetical protein
VKSASRKDLPSFGYLEHLHFDITELIQFCRSEGFFDFDHYSDIQVSSNSKMKEFVLSNSFNKANFFTEEDAPYLEGEKYKQRYLTEIFDHVRKRDQLQNEVKKDSIFFRQKRLKKSYEEYDPFSDELNYGKRNQLVYGVFEKILDSFKAKVTRVRLAYLAPGFSLKPHIDYDPAYITRYHIPILTHPLCRMYTTRNDHIESTHFAADGRVYFLNAGIKHWADNLSDQARVHLIVDTHGQQDLKLGLKMVNCEGEK